MNRVIVASRLKEPVLGDCLLSGPVTAGRNGDQEPLGGKLTADMVARLNDYVDAVMGRFRTPVAHPNDAVRAVLTGVDVRRALQRFNDEMPGYSDE